MIAPFLSLVASLALAQDAGQERFSLGEFAFIKREGTAWTAMETHDGRLIIMDEAVAEFLIKSDSLPLGHDFRDSILVQKYDFPGNQVRLYVPAKPPEEL